MFNFSKKFLIILALSFSSKILLCEQIKLEPIFDTNKYIEKENSNKNNRSQRDDQEALDLFTQDVDNLPKPDFKPSHPVIKYTKMFGSEIVCFYLDLRKSMIKKYKKLIKAIKVLRYNIN